MGGRGGGEREEGGWCGEIERERERERRGEEREGGREGAERDPPRKKTGPRQSRARRVSGRGVSRGTSAEAGTPQRRTSFSSSALRSLSRTCRRARAGALSGRSPERGGVCSEGGCEQGRRLAPPGFARQLGEQRREAARRLPLLPLHLPPLAFARGPLAAETGDAACLVQLCVEDFADVVDIIELVLRGVQLSRTCYLRSARSNDGSRHLIRIIIK